MTMTGRSSESLRNLFHTENEKNLKIDFMSKWAWYVGRVMTTLQHLSGLASSSHTHFREHSQSLGLLPRSHSPRDSPPWCGPGWSLPHCSQTGCWPRARLCGTGGAGHLAALGPEWSAVIAAHCQMRVAVSVPSWRCLSWRASWDISPGIGSSSPGPRLCSLSGGLAGSGPSVSAAQPSPARWEEDRLLSWSHMVMGPLRKYLLSGYSVPPLENLLLIVGDEQRGANIRE